MSNEVLLVKTLLIAAAVPLAALISAALDALLDWAEPVAGEPPAAPRRR